MEATGVLFDNDPAFPIKDAFRETLGHDVAVVMPCIGRVMAERDERSLPRVDGSVGPTGGT